MGNSPFSLKMQSISTLEAIYHWADNGFHNSQGEWIEGVSPGERKEKRANCKKKKRKRNKEDQCVTQLVAEKHVSESQASCNWQGTVQVPLGKGGSDISPMWVSTQI